MKRFRVMLWRTVWSRFWWTGFVPWRQTGYASWCGHFVIWHAPRHLSVLMGRGTLGLELYRKTER